MRIFQEKYRLIWVLGLILVVGFITIGTISYLVSRDAIRAGITQQALPLTADNVYSEIQKDLLRPVFVSSMMAQDTFVRDWMLGGEREVSRITRYLNEVKIRYGANSAFLVSERSRRYYAESGVLKTVDQGDLRDAWYFRVRKMSALYESNLDPDEANHDQLTVFINYRVFDYRGNYIGATGVGLTLDQVGGHIDRYQSAFNRRIYFVDKRGDIVLTGKSKRSRQGSIRDIPGISGIADRILAGNGKPQQLEYHQGSSLVMVNARYIPELGSHLVVEQDESENIKDLWQVLKLNLGIGASLTFLALLVIGRAINRYQRRIARMTEEALVHADRETKMAREQQEFVAMVSHEFRTPMAIIDSSLQSLKHLESGISAEAAANFHRIRRASLRMQELVSNYLVQDRISQALHPAVTEVDLYPLVMRTAERSEWPDMDCSGIAQLAAKVFGETELLQIVFFNLINNAIKYSSPGGLIRISGSVDGGYAEVRITDRGCGISPQALPHIFEKHYRAPNNIAGGTGLGLYIVKCIVDLHRGEVMAESSPGQGATFIVRIPLAVA